MLPQNVDLDLNPFSSYQDELKNELEELEQEQLNDRLMGAERAPVHSPAPKITSYAEERESESSISCCECRRSRQQKLMRWHNPLVSTY